MSRTQVQIYDNVLDILERCTVHGNQLSLPDGQLTRSEYTSVNKILELMGGKWNRSVKSHIFSEDPTDLLDTVMLTGEIADKKKQFQFFETPAGLAARMVVMADLKLHDLVLEPSAGRGRIAAAICQHQIHRLTMIELDINNLSVLSKLPEISYQCDIHQGDFLEYTSGLFDKIVMNPPLSRGQDIAHIRHAMTLLKPNGFLVSICADGPRQRAALRHVVDTWEHLCARTFKESGTNVKTALVTWCKR